MNGYIGTVIVGAGPYGLSIAAHLRGAGARFRIFGTPMRTWREQMPKGMWLKSDGFASNLSDPADSFTLRNYCRQNNVVYDDTRIPVQRAVFAEYGVAFQKKLVPELEEKDIVAIEQTADGFRLQAEDGECILAQRVILAVGISHFASLPKVLAALPASHVAHSSVHRDLDIFAGRRVAVIGSGASSVDVAALLREGGAETTLIIRGSALRFHDAPSDVKRTLVQRLRHPGSGLGPGLRSRIYSDYPQLFRLLPGRMRAKIVKTHLKPAAGYAVRPLVDGKVPVLGNRTIERAEVVGDAVQLHLRSTDGSQAVHEFDYVIAGTGYKPLVSKLGFLSEPLRASIRTLEGAPVLSANFESTVPGLYFVGLAAAYSFGPLLRFAFGADFTARRLTRHLARRTQTAHREAASPAAVEVHEVAP